MNKIDKGNPIPGAIAAKVQRGISQHKAIASTGVDTKPAAPVKF